MKSKTSARTQLAIAAASAMFAGSFFIDRPVANLIKAFQGNILTIALDQFTRLYTPIYISLLVLTAILLFRRSKSERLKTALVMGASILASFALTALLKQLAHRPRPDGAIYRSPFLGTPDFSFPSGHTAMAASAAFSTPVLNLTWAIFTCITVFSRVYTNAHFFSDTAGAILISLLVTTFVKSRIKVSDEDFVELRRQAVHAAFGIAIALFVKGRPSLWWILLVIASFGMAISYLLRIDGKSKILRKWKKIAFGMLSTVERKKEFAHFPGKGAIMLFAGSGITAALFREQAPVAILVLAVGDSMSPIAGRLFGRAKHRWPFSKEKTIEGSVFGFVFACMAASVLVPFPLALAASALAMAVEALHLRLMKVRIDDNITIPLAASIPLWLLR